MDSYLVEGTGYDFIPRVLDRTIIDEWIKTEDTISMEMGRRLIQDEGLFVGATSGAAVDAAVRWIKKNGWEN